LNGGTVAGSNYRRYSRRYGIVAVCLAAASSLPSRPAQRPLSLSLLLIINLVLIVRTDTNHRQATSHRNLNRTGNYPVAENRVPLRTRYQPQSRLAPAAPVILAAASSAVTAQDGILHSRTGYINELCTPCRGLVGDRVLTRNMRSSLVRPASSLCGPIMYPPLRPLNPRTLRLRFLRLFVNQLCDTTSTS
jgi:hypothetical protein